MSEAYLKECFKELNSKDGLCVMARGLGLKNVFIKSLLYHCKGLGNSNRGVIFCINVLDNSSNNYDESAGYSSVNICNALLAEGLMPYELPKIITNEVPAQERVDMYSAALDRKGNCVFLITSRILIVDMLDNRIQPLNIKGFYIPNAHRINEFSVEAFILRVYREENTTGFMKAFCEDPEALSTSYRGSSKLLLCLKQMFLRSLYLYPRNHPLIVSSLDVTAFQHEVTEMGIPLTKPMAIIQSAILAAIKACISELKKSTMSIGVLDEVLTLESGQLFSSGLDLTIRRLLDPEWHRVTPKAKNLLSDLADLRKLLDYLLRYDAFSFYYFLLKLKQASTDNTNNKTTSTPALWLLTEPADHIFTKAKERVYKIIPKSQYLDLLKKSSESKSSANNLIQSVVVPPENLQIDSVLLPVLEIPPKWRILKQLVSEIKEIISANKNELGTSQRMKKHRIVIFVRDDMTSSQLQDFLTYDESFIMDQRYRWFISQQTAEIRRASVVAAGLKAKRARSTTSSSNQRIPPTYVPVGLSEFIEASPPTSNTSSEANNKLIYGVDAREFANLSIEKKLLLIEENKLIYKTNIQKANMKDANDSQESAKDLSMSLTDECNAQDSNLSNYISLEEDTRDSDDDDFESDPVDKGSDRDNKSNTNRPEYLSGKKRKASTQDHSKSKGLSLIKAKAPISSLTNNSSIARDNNKEDVFEGLLFDWKVPEASHIKDSSDNRETFLSAESMILIITHSEATSSYFNVLEEIQPDFVIMYDVEVSLIRAIEVYQASRYSTASTPLKVYFTYYDESAEKHRYADSLSREKKAFETLDSMVKSGMVSSVPLPDPRAHIAAAKAEDKEISSKDSRDLRYMSDLEFRTNAIPLDSSLADTSSQRKNNPITMMKNSSTSETSKQIVVVDVREFRSSLPSLLHASGFTIVPRTLAVGDYVLAAEIVVERKGISDLFQSFASGRLYNQVESMSKYYKHPCLLIEFSPDKPFSFQAEIPTDIQSNHITSKISILTLAFPNLRILWSKSPLETGNIFLSLLNGQEPVDVVKAMNAGSSQSVDFQNQSSSLPHMPTQPETVASETRLLAQEMLLSLPGVNVHNFRLIMNSVTNLNELSRLDEKDISAIIGPVNAKKLVTFFKQRLAIS